MNPTDAQRAMARPLTSQLASWRRVATPFAGMPLKRSLLEHEGVHLD